MIDFKKIIKLIETNVSLFFERIVKDVQEKKFPKSLLVILFIWLIMPFSATFSGFFVKTAFFLLAAYLVLKFVEREL